MKSSKMIFPLRKQKYHIFANFNWIDVIVFCCFLLISIIIASINSPLVPRLTTSLIFVALGFIFNIKINDDMQLYYYIYIATIFVLRPKQINLNADLYRVVDNIICQSVVDNLYFTAVELNINVSDYDFNADVPKLTITINKLLSLISGKTKIIKYNTCSESIPTSLSTKPEFKLKQKSELYKSFIKSQAKYNILRKEQPELKIVFIVYDQSKIQLLKTINQILLFSNKSIINAKQLSSSDVISIILNQFSSQNLKAKSNNVVSRNNTYKISAVDEFSYNTQNNWLKYLCTTDENVVINLNFIEKTDAIKKLDQCINKTKDKLTFSISTNCIEETKVTIENYTALQSNINSGKDSLWDAQFYIIENTNTKTNKITCLKYLTKVFKIKLNNLKFRSYNALQDIFFITNLSKQTIVEVSQSVLSNQLWLPTNQLKDNPGVVLFKNAITSEYLTFNLKQKDLNRINNNTLILGESGAGKSFLAKQLLLGMISENTNIYIIDPEHEYKPFIKEMGGRNINLKSLSFQDQLNPLQLTSSLKQISKSRFFETHAFHFAFIEEILKSIFPTILSNRLILDKVIEIIKQTYIFGIKERLDNITFNHVYKHYKTINHKYSLDTNKYLKVIFQNLDKMTSNLNKKKSSVFTKNNNLVCFNSNGLNETLNSNFIALQTSLILHSIEQNIINSHNKDSLKFHFVMIDEAHLLLTNDNPLAKKVILRLIKRIRKYNGGVIIITQNLKNILQNDLTDIFNNCQYLFIGGQQAQDLTDLTKLFCEVTYFSKSSANFISSATQGQFWFKCSKSSNYKVNVLDNLEDTNDV